MNKIILFLMLISPISSFAQIECQAEANRLCSDFSTRPERTSCLLLNKDKIKDMACRARVSNQTQAAYNVCLDDYFQYCEKKYPSSLSAAYECLMKNRSSLSAACKILLPTQ